MSEGDLHIRYGRTGGINDLSGDRAGIGLGVSKEAQAQAQGVNDLGKTGVSRAPAGIAPGSSSQARPSVNGQALLEMV